MKNNLFEKIKLSTIIYVFLILALLIIVGILIFQLQSVKSDTSKTISALEGNVSFLENKVSVLTNKLNNISTLITDTETKNSATAKKTLNDNEKKEIFNKMTNNKNFIIALVESKDFTIKEFIDKEILSSLTIYDKNGEFFTYDSNTMTCSGNLDKIEKLSTLVFNKTIDMGKVTAKIEANNVTEIKTFSNFANVNLNLIDVILNDNNNSYDVNFNYIATDNTSNAYTMNISIIDNNIVYNNLVK